MVGCSRMIMLLTGLCCVLCHVVSETVMMDRIGITINSGRIDGDD